MTDHAIQRAKERYGLDLTPADLLPIIARIKAGGGVLVRRTITIPTREEYLIDVMGKATRVLFQPGSDIIITFIPPEGGFQKERRIVREAKVKGRLSKRELQELRADE